MTGMLVTDQHQTVHPTGPNISAHNSTHREAVDDTDETMIFMVYPGAAKGGGGPNVAAGAPLVPTPTPSPT